MSEVSYVRCLLCNKLASSNCCSDCVWVKEVVERELPRCRKVTDEEMTVKEDRAARIKLSVPIVARRVGKRDDMRFIQGLYRVMFDG